MYAIRSYYAIMYNECGSTGRQPTGNGFMQLDRRQNALLLGFITLSLLLHLLLRNNFV